MNRSVLLAACLFVMCGLAVPSTAAGDDDSSADGSAAAELSMADLFLKTLHEPDGWSAHRGAAREGVQVFKKAIEGIRAPGFRGEKTVAVSSDRLFALLVDFDNHVAMSTRVPLVVSKVLRAEGDTVDFFQLVDTPGWTMARDRCWFNRARIRRNVDGEEGRHIQEWWNLEPGQFPQFWQEVLQQYPRVLAIPVNVGSWEVVPLGTNSSRLIYRVVSDPGGRIPPRMQQFVTGKTLPDNLLQFEDAALGRAVK